VAELFHRRVIITAGNKPVVFAFVGLLSTNSCETFEGCMRCFTTNKSFDFGADSLRITIRIHQFLTEFLPQQNYKSYKITLLLIMKI